MVWITAPTMLAGWLSEISQMLYVDRVGKIKLCITFALMVFVASCSSDEQADYTEVTEREFLAACTDPLNDDRIIADLCECVFDRIQTEVNYEDFVRDDKTVISANSTNSTIGTANTIPEVYAEFVADCVIEEAEL